jgi:predicted O-linked N-acetylglucosamine transferase (SPINDLY family)
MSHASSDLQKQAITAFAQNNYAEAAFLYEQLAEREVDQLSHVWYLGLARLFIGQEAEAQLTWMMALASVEPELIEPHTEELVEILQTEAERQEAKENWSLAWTVRHHLREIAPDNITNLLHLVRLTIQLELDDPCCLENLGLVELLQTGDFFGLDQTLLGEIITAALDYWGDDSQVKALIEAALGKSKALVQVLLAKAIALNSYGTLYEAQLAAYLAEVCLREQPHNLEALSLLASFYEGTRQYQKSVEIARRFRDACQTVDEKMIGNGFLAARMLRSGLHLQDAIDLFEQQKALLEELLTEYQPHPDHSLVIAIVPACCFHSYYLEDAPAKHRKLQNQLADSLQSDIQSHAGELPQRHRPNLSSRTRKLRIGYIAHYMRQHSVGWLARWLLQYHDHTQFEVYTYHVHMQDGSDPFTNRWFIQPVTHSVQFDQKNCVEMAKQIRQDEIDILIDLDSITYDHTYGTMALKPAPVQVTWLGFDASGIPAVDYYIADPYVLPESAQDYYSETIWRLPSTYLAVDGFEVGVPTLRREQLDIPDQAIVYLSSQSGQKRHPKTIHMQIKILRQVPNSYLLIKGLADETSIKQTFEQIAEAEGVAVDRLRFLERDPDEPTHRANLAIADVVLDTYPYNGATTTLETLWMGIPVVTRVGQQWAARNSYTMLMNVGVSEGIAWTDEEYVEWGVRLGQDAKLRQDIHWRLLQSRQTSPLWNTRLFAKEMENAYRQMWERYCNS